MDQGLIESSSGSEEMETGLNIDEEFKSLEAGLNLIISKIEHKTELLNKSQMQADEIKDKIKSLEETPTDPEGLPSVQSRLISLISEQQQQNLIIKKENDQLSLKISEIHQTLNSSTSLLESKLPSPSPHELKEKIQETKKNLEYLSSLKSKEIKNISKIRNLIQELEAKTSTSKEKTQNLLEIKQNLTNKIQNIETSCEAIHEKIKIHQTEEQKLAEKLFIVKRETEEALLSFQKFKFRLASLFKPEYSILITRKSSGLLILLQSSKQEILITKDTHCSVTLNKKRPDHFYLTTDNKTREFESKDAQKIVSFLNLAIQLSSEE